MPGLGTASRSTAWTGRSLEVQGPFHGLRIHFNSISDDDRAESFLQELGSLRQKHSSRKSVSACKP